MLLIALSLMTVLSVDAKNKVRVITHRGYWNTENSARNSVSALNNAIEIKAYGAEFDVNMTADGVLRVHHDAKTTNGILIEESTFADLRAKAPKLDNGELIPTLDDYLTSWNHAKKTKLICEIKEHSTPEFETRVVEAVLAKMEEYGVSMKDVEFISFSYHVCKELKRLCPTAVVLPLSTEEATPEQMLADGMDGFDLHYTVLRKNPQWVEFAKEHKMIVNVWTVNTEDVMREMIDLGVDYITTDEPVLLQQVLSQKRR